MTLLLVVSRIEGSTVIVFDALTGAELRMRDLLCHSLVVGALSGDLVSAPGRPARRRARGDGGGVTPSDRHLSDVLHATQAVIELRQERERAVVASPWIRNELDPVSRERASEDLEKDVAGWLAAREGAE